MHAQSGPTGGPRATDDHEPDAEPLVIGGLGGSGTRVVADALLDGGVDLGRLLNGAQDNLVFTAMFKRPRWRARVGDEVIGRHLATFTRYSRGRRLTAGDVTRLLGCVVDHDPTVGRRESAGRVRRALRRPPRAGRAPAPAWGWKEPNSHLYLPQLIEHFPGLRFVYVARHGLDMAFNTNTTQLRLFGAQFGVPYPSGGPDEVAAAQLGYWIHMTRRALDLGARLGDRFLFVRFDDVCRDPERELRRVADFAGVEPAPDVFATRVAAVTVPSSMGRWRDRPVPFLTDEQRDAVRGFGFAV